MKHRQRILLIVLPVMTVLLIVAVSAISDHYSNPLITRVGKASPQFNEAFGGGECDFVRLRYSIGADKAVVYKCWHLPEFTSPRFHPWHRWSQMFYEAWAVKENDQWIFYRTTIKLQRLKGSLVSETTETNRIPVFAR